MEMNYIGPKSMKLLQEHSTRIDLRVRRGVMDRRNRRDWRIARPKPLSLSARPLFIIQLLREEH